MGRQFTPWDRLTELRRNAGLEQEDLARAVGYSRPHINQLEIGRVGCSEKLLFKLAACLGVPAGELGRSAPPVPPRGSGTRRDETPSRVA